MMRRLIIFLASGICFASCGICRHSPTEITVVRDSIAVRYVDSTVVHIDTVRVAIPQESSSAVAATSDTSHLETSVAESDAWLDPDGRLHHSLRNKDTELLRPIVIPEHFRIAEAQCSRTEQIIRQVEVPRQLTRWQKFLIRSGTILWILISIIISVWLFSHCSKRKGPQ